MKMLKLTFAVFSLLLLTSPIMAQTDLPSAEEIMKKYVEATGGADAYKSIKSLKAEAVVGIAQVGVEGEMNMTMKAPDKLAVVVDMGGIGKQMQGTNGKFTWSSDAMMGPRLLKGKEADQLKDPLEFDKYLNPGKYYESVKVAGKEDVNGDPAYKVELVKKSGQKQTEFYDVKSGLLVKQLMTTEAQGMGEITIESFVSNYKKSGKFKVPFKMVQKLPNGMEMSIEFTKFEYNAEVEDSAFAPPADIKKLIEKEESKGDQ